jgi:SAM-dependent methyltransferase
MGACRSCGSASRRLILSLGDSPLANSYLRADQLSEVEPRYPLDVYLCEDCFLVQLDALETPENIFSDYAYFSSYSTTWLAHAEQYVSMMRDRFSFGAESQVVEIASNDGYLLQYFQAGGVPVLGIEPAANVAQVAEDKGIPTRVAFWGKGFAESLAGEGLQADLIVGNNVLAHVPELNDFVAGLKIMLKPGGIVTMEFPHLVRLIAENQFDTIYHEHFSYFSFLAVCQVFARQGLTVFDVEELSTHGGSLRVFVRHEDDACKPILDSVGALHDRETEAGLATAAYYDTFAAAVVETKRGLQAFCRHVKDEGKRLAAYGAPAKGNTLLNYCEIGTDDIAYTLDRNPHKQGMFLPGTQIPIFAPEHVHEDKPDYLLILPWNLKDEIAEQMACIREWGGRFVAPIPRVLVLP